ncbi:unnamed protein product, partial [Phaeothamnion confervicola]
MLTLPEGLMLTHVRALHEDKDALCSLCCERQYIGRTLVFADSMAGARRRTVLLALLWLAVAALLHAQMQQWQRRCNLDLFWE